MEKLFSEILNMSMTSSVVIFIVLVARLALRKVPKIYSYALWSVVLFRLLCPVSLQSPVSVLEVAGPQVTRTEGIATSVSYIPAANIDPEPMTEVQPALSVQPQVESPKPAVEPITIVTWTWLAGAAIMLLRSMVSYLQLRRRLIGAIPLRGNVYLADHIATPFVEGLLQPKIYLPSGTPSGERLYIISHEQHHIRRGDHILKWIAYFALCLHWFNPLVWIAFVQAGKDMEMSCDEAVIKKLGPQIRADYSASLLRLATGQRIIAGTPLAFGEGDTKGRIKNMAKWKKPKVWVSALCLLLCLCVLIACGMNPEGASGVEVILDDFHVQLPEYYTAEAEGDESVVFTKEEETVGGLIKHVSQFQLKFGGAYDQKEQNTFAWLEELGIPEIHDWSIGVSNSDDILGARNRDDVLVVDCHPVNAEDFGRYRFLWFGEGDDVYDLWFDKTRIGERDIEDIVDTVYLTASSESPVKVSGLPAVYTFETDENGDIIFTDGTNTVGGVIGYPIPDGLYDPEDTSFLWLEEMGIPDFEDPGLCYLGGMTAANGGWLAEFASDVPPGTEVTVDRRHHFYVVGNMVYDIWFDMLKVDFAVSEDIRNAVTLPGAALSETNEPTEEDLACSKVRSVFDAVQSGAHQLQIRQENAGNEGPKAYLTTYFDDGENWLRLHEVLPEGTNQTEAGDYYNRMAHLSHKGFYYSNNGHWGERGAIQWTAIGQKDLEAVRQERTSMLASFQWLRSNVTYMDTLTDENGQCIMYRVDKKYADDPGYADHYFVNFYFDPSGNFKEAKLQVNLYQENEFTVTESIVTLDAEEVAAQIDSYFLYGRPMQMESKVEGERIVAGSETILYGNLAMTLPEDYTCREENGTVILTRGGVDVGGIASWAAPEEGLTLVDKNTLGNMSEWVRALGVPEAQESDEPIGYMIENSAYGDLEAHFFNELNPEKLNIKHHFFIDGAVVYDVYYDQNVLSSGWADRFLKTILLYGERIVPEQPEEEEALIRCRNILDLVQAGSHGIAVKHWDSGGLALNDRASGTYYRDQDNWLSIGMIPESDQTSVHGYMVVDGVGYNNEGNGWDEENHPNWKEGITYPAYISWLSTYQWNEETVVYEETLRTADKNVIMLRIDEPFPFGEAYGENNPDSYFVKFCFTDSGEFQYAELCTFLSHGSIYTKQESIITLDTNTVTEEILKEYERAVG